MSLISWLCPSHAAQLPSRSLPYVRCPPVGAGWPGGAAAAGRGIRYRCRHRVHPPVALPAARARAARLGHRERPRCGAGRPDGEPPVPVSVRAGNGQGIPSGLPFPAPGDRPGCVEGVTRRVRGGQGAAQRRAPVLGGLYLQRCR
ncbi:hypothetical protein G6F57_019359 [Rhizopus arrhizus]|nr:hypothetical protein G6F57_019359 [Rhizopus arrhizus]